MDLISSLHATTGINLGLLAASFAFGLRHGIDWDHIAAITDITASQDSPRAGLRLGTLYVLGHAAVVLVLGTVAIFIGDRLPPSVDETMGKMVGVTLVVLGVYVVYSLIRHGREFRMQSRWMLVIRAARAGARWVKSRLAVGAGSDVHHDHDHLATSHYHHEDEGEELVQAGGRLRGPTHRHSHRHPVSADPRASYSTKTALGIGALHGIGAETPTQILIFIAAAGAGGTGAGLAVLFVFLAGLVASNSLITLGSTFGFVAASRRFSVYASLGVITALVSLSLGTLLLLGKESMLPTLLGG